MATVEVSGNEDDVQQVMNDVWTGRCGFGKSRKVGWGVLLNSIMYIFSCMHKYDTYKYCSTTAHSVLCNF